MVNVVDGFLPYIFAVNTLLVIVDAALGYFVAPLLLKKMSGENPGSPAWTIGATRRLLSIIVALYMFFNCLAYFGTIRPLLLLVTIVVLFDIIFQLAARWKLGRQS